jgi:hypothetical protein
MQLERDALDAVIRGEGRHLDPEGDGLVPLAVQERERVRGPRVPDPVDRRGVSPITGAPRHRHDLLHAEQPGQPDDVADQLGMLRADDRVERPGGAVEGRDP